MGFINKEQATSQIIDAIGQILQGKIYVSGPLSERLLNRAVGKSPDEEKEMESPISELSDRELEVFQLFGKGLDTHQVAERMHISRKTVETYRGRIKQKLNINGATELVCRAVQWTLENG